MTTYANIKLNEIFALYGNPFTRGSCKTNFNEKIVKKYYKKVNFEEEKSKEIKHESNIDENSQIRLLNKNENHLLIISSKKNMNMKFGEILNSKLNSKINNNTDAFSMNSNKKKSQKDLIKKSFVNNSLEEYGDNTKMSSVFQNKKKIGNNEKV
jgi:hypothetical protein